MICFEHVSKFVLSDVEVHIPKGAAVGLIGESGAGKTTFVKLACGLLAPDTGRVRTLLREPVTNRQRFGREISTFMAGVPVLSPEESVRNGLELLGGVYGMSRREWQEAYRELAAVLGFGAFEVHPVKSLSLGQRMRAELGATLLYAPKLLLLDEPSVGLDGNAKQSLEELLSKRVSQGMTLLISSHNMEEIAHLCNRVLYLRKGKVGYYGTVEQLQNEFAPYTIMTMKVADALPDLGDLPLSHYQIEQNKLTLTFSNHYITSAEVLKVLLAQTRISEVSIRKSDLTDVILGVRH